MMNKPTVDRDGRWLLPMALWRTEGSARVVASTDRGVTFAQIGAANVPRKEDRNCDEPMLVQRQDGALWLLVRTRYGIGESLSTDGGKTWPDVAPDRPSRTRPRASSSGGCPAGTFCSCGTIRPTPPECARISRRLCPTTTAGPGRGACSLDERRNVSYPDGIQAANGLIYVIYDWERQRDKEILMAVFREEDVRQGKMISPDGRLRVRVNQATGVNPTVAAQTTRAANADGKPLLKEPAAELEFAEGEADVLAPGATLFLDRKYVAQEVPEALRGSKFVRLNITGGRIVCRQPGAVYLITPSAGRQRDSQAEALLKAGFQKVDLPSSCCLKARPTSAPCFKNT